MVERISRALVFCAILSLIGGHVLPARAADRVEAAGEFSYTPPNGWRVTEIPGLKYRVAVTTPAQGFAPNINVVDESFSGTIQEDVRRNLEALQKGLPEFKSLGQSAFTTTSGLKGAKLVTQSRQQGRLLRQVIYFLPGRGDRKYVVTFSGLAEEGGKYDPQVDAAVKTFVLK